MPNLNTVICRVYVRRRKKLQGKERRKFGFPFNLEDFPFESMELVGFWVPAKPLRFEHWGARKDLPLTDHTLTLFAISKLGTTNSQHKRHKIYTGSGHRCGVIPYSSVVWWIASWAGDE